MNLPIPFPAALPAIVNDLTDSDIIRGCDAYRAHWSRERAGGAGVLEFLQQNQIEDANRGATCLLIQVDMECLWEHWSQWVLSAMRSGQTAGALLDAWKELPRVQHYAGLFEGPEQAAEYWAELVGCESYCRDRWGDAVGSCYYEHRFQVKTQEFLRRPRRHLRCEFESNDDYSQVLFPLRGINEIGRQRSRDNQPYFFQPKPDGNRIVVASREEAEVSREQLTLQLLSPQIAIVTNRSNVNAIRIIPDQTLPCEQRVALQFPFTIQLPGRRLACY